MPTSLLIDRRWIAWCSGTVKTTQSWTCSKLWISQWTLGSSPKHQPLSQYPTTQCQPPRPSSFWELQFPMTWNGNPTSTRLSEKPSRGCTFGLPQELLKQFYAVTEPVLCTSITIWLGAATEQEQTAANSKNSETEKGRKWAGRISTDPSHPWHNLFTSSSLSGATKLTGTIGHRNSFFLQAITLINSSTGVYAIGCVKAPTCFLLPCYVTNAHYCHLHL